MASQTPINWIHFLLKHYQLGIKKKYWSSTQITNQKYWNIATKCSTGRGFFFPTLAIKCRPHLISTKTKIKTTKETALPQSARKGRLYKAFISSVDSHACIEMEVYEEQMTLPQKEWMDEHVRRTDLLWSGGWGCWKEGDCPNTNGLWTREEGGFAAWSKMEGAGKLGRDWMGFSMALSWSPAMGKTVKTTTRYWMN